MKDIGDFVPEYNELDEQDISSIQKFTFLWSYFEFKLLGTNASPKKISDLVESWYSEGKLDNKIWTHALDYFKNRYIDDGKTNYRFEALLLRSRDNPKLVEEVLLGNEKHPVKCFVATLTIIYRFRNNLFHGMKWQYNIQDQRENFDASSCLIGECISQYKAAE